MVFTCTTNTGFVSWTDNFDGNGALGFSGSNSIGHPPRQFGIFKIALISVNGNMFVSTATVDNATFYNYNILSRSKDQYSNLTKYVKMELLIDVYFNSCLFLWKHIYQT